MTDLRDLPHTNYNEVKPDRYFDTYEGQKSSNTGLLIAFAVVVLIAGGLMMFSGGTSVGEAELNDAGIVTQPPAAPTIPPATKVE